MRHSPDSCREVDCEECTNLVDAGLVYGCDGCGKTLHSDQVDHIYDENTGRHSCLDCLKTQREAQLKEDNKNCYNYLLSTYIEDEDKAVFVAVKRFYSLPFSIRNGPSPVGGAAQCIINNLTNYPDDVINKSLDKLIEIFDIRENVMRTGLSGTIITGFRGLSYTTSGVIAVK